MIGMNFFKNRFLFIIVISVITLVLLVVGAVSLYQDHSSIFEGDGYIIETTTKANKKYYFSANTKYKENVDDKITFSDQESKKVSVDPASFVHYNNGDVSFLKKGALVNLAELSNPMVTYYNITDENVITYDKDSYVVSSNGKQINIDSFIGRINDNKYIIAGKNLSLKVPTIDERIDGDYFEILYVEEGIVRIDNKDHSYQVTAQDSYVYVGDDITINLGDGKIFYNGTPKMLMSQITINGDENIDLDVLKNGTDGNGGAGTGTGDGTGENNGENTDGTGEVGDGTGEGGTGDDATGTSSGGIGGTGVGNKATASPQIELIEAKVTSTSIDLSLQLNNAGLAKSDIVYHLKNAVTGAIVNDISASKINLVNGTFQIAHNALEPSTEYVLSIGELTSGDDKQYFQKTFKTNDLGISLEKVYATSDELSYKINFEEGSEVDSAHLVIYDHSGSETEQVGECTITKADLSHSCAFKKLKSNTNYSVSIDNIWIHDVVYSNYTINRLDSTLKITPTLQGIKVTPNAEEVTFNIKLEKVTDPDNAIVNYVYRVYNANDVTSTEGNPKVIYSVVKSDTSPLLLNLHEIKELKTGVDYRVKIVAQYHDNEMIREVSTDYSSNFLIRSKPNVSFAVESISMNNVTGTLTLSDANCSVPIVGRSCASERNNFVVRYYKVKDGESTFKEVSFEGFNPNTLNYALSLNELSSNTAYAMKVYGNYYDDEGLIHNNVQIGDTLYFTTDKSVNLHMEVTGDNTSGVNENGEKDPHTVVTFNAKLAAPAEKVDSIMNTISTITLNLYSGRYNTKEKLIGTYEMTDHSEIEYFFNNLTITNKMFNDVTNFHVGKLNNLNSLIKVTNNVTQTLNSDYTVEIEDVYDEGKANKFKVDDNVYTFHLTDAYYLDSRLISGGGKYIAVTPIKKEQLTESEANSLASSVTNLDELNKSTVVGLVVENSLSDIYVDSAFTYEKVTVKYSVYNNVTKKTVFTYDEDMGNKYQPKVQRFFLDMSTLDDGEHFTRGYNYTVSYSLNFVTEDGSNPTYTHELLSSQVSIDRQTPIYTQYISKSTNNDITYRYMFSDVDLALSDKNFYYSLGDSTNYSKLENVLVADKKEHDVTFPIGERSKYRIAYYRKTNSGLTQPVDIASYDFEKEYQSVSSVSYRILNDNDNTLKLRLEKNDVTSRAVAYKVNIKAKDNSVSDYSIFFLANRLSTLNVDTGRVDDEGEKIYDSYQYIAIDYAAISRFMKHQMEIEVVAYFDSGLVGLHQTFTDGFVLKNDNKYLNINNNDISFTSTAKVLEYPAGIHMFREEYHDGDENFYIYNYLRDINNYKPFRGVGYYADSFDVGGSASKIGINFKISPTNAGLVYNYNNVDYAGYNAKVLKKSTLVTDNNKAYFEEIIPTINVSSKNTINSVDVSITASGIYGNTQFVKDGAPHKKVYVSFYADENKSQLLKTISSDVTINGSDEAGYSASIEDVIYSDLKPDTSYYFTVSAYIEGKYVQLYDSASSINSYVAKTYVAKTLGTEGILDRIIFKANPVSYHGDISDKRITWRVVLKETSNYKLRFELYAKDGEALEDGTYRYKAVKFDGSNATSCNVNTVGSASSSYISNCYISVGKDDIASINKNEIKYDFRSNDFVFGDGYYRLVVYAVPYTNNVYNESDKVVLYDNLGLKKVTDEIFGEKRITHTIDVSALEAATFSLQQQSDVSDGLERDVFIKFVPIITDNSYVMKYGKYTISLLDSNGTVVSNCDAYVNGTKVGSSLSPCTIELDNEVNTNIMFGGNLVANAMYSVNFSYDTYRNNVGFSEEQKISVTPSRSFIYSPNKYGVVLGQVTSSLVSNQSVALTYSGSHLLSNKVRKILYTITLNGGLGNKVSGFYSVREADGNTSEIFSISSTGMPRFVIDLANDRVSSDTTFTFKNGNSYLIDLQYYTEDNNLIGTSNMLLSL